jgi:hypothetical protein
VPGCVVRLKRRLYTGNRATPDEWPPCAAVVPPHTRPSVARTMLALLPTSGRSWRTGPLVDEELLRAIRSGSSSAIQYWWRVTMETVWQAFWRDAVGG